MINRSVFCMILCLLSSPLVSMQKKRTLTVNDLDAFTIVLKLEDYETRLEKCVLEPSVVTDIIKILLEPETDDFSKRIETMYESKPDDYTQLVTCLTLHYYAKRNDDTPSEIDVVKAEIYKYLK
jgi:hypothetical protein